ncbi:uncharacterized protein LOC124556392 [Schistocerca americana]|uniref:uncharacterized protein LOC124556392 n=1 Tax=Schistocerca americana TaxID=7009 RepID=UPI001F500689|nr:uncharacterized protein LOC124556392 [Schistocerca americana]
MTYHTTLVARMIINDFTTRWSFDYRSSHMVNLMLQLCIEKIIISVSCWITDHTLQFLLYIDDISTKLAAGNTTIFADDTSILISGTDTEDHNQKIKLLMSSLSKWFRENKLIINIQKTTYINFRLSSQKQEMPDVILNNQELMCVDSVKFLGIWLAENLKWETHTNYISKKLSTACYILRILKKSVTKSVLIHSYLLNNDCTLKFNGDIHNYATRQQSDLHMIQARTTC